MAFHNELGKQGEDIACEFLRKKGYLILDRNWHLVKAELDVVAYHDNHLVIVEIKTRSLQVHTNSDDMIGKKKLHLLFAAADEYVRQKQVTWEVRYDLVTVIYHGDTWTVEHEENAFYPFMNL